ncbi:MAG: hypothetical protein JWR49_3844, partial [Tardiphaga sp.]|nr:hypothetical protein [Tardiphaga sp.]
RKPEVFSGLALGHIPAEFVTATENDHGTRDRSTHKKLTGRWQMPSLLIRGREPKRQPKC